jgi:hypothetical protein
MWSLLNFRRIAAAAAVAGCLASAGVYAQQELVMEPLKDAGLNVYPAFEGWYQNPDGASNLADRIKASRHISSLAAAGALRRSRCRRTSATRN